MKRKILNLKQLGFVLLAAGSMALYSCDDGNSPADEATEEAADAIEDVGDAIEG